jgi:hypothetical protein
VTDLRGEGRVDLNMRFTFSLAFFRTIMANEGAIASVVSWPGEEPLETESVFATDGVGEVPFGTIGEVMDWELVLPSTSNRVCSEYKNYVFPMYEMVFKAWVSGSLSLISRGTCFVGPSCHLLRFIRTLMLL